MKTAHMKRTIFALMFFAAAASTYSFDIVVHDYLPSLRGSVAGEKTKLNRFIGHENAYTLSLPMEIKFTVASAEPISFSAICAYTFFITKPDGLAACIASLGMGIGNVSEKKMSGLWGLYANMYPLYEFPVATFGHDPVALWKFAVDIGYAFSLGFDNYSYKDYTFWQAIYLSLYIRTIGALENHTNKFMIVPPDIGITIGVHLSTTKKQANVIEPET